jgi:putative ATPase
MELFDKLAQDAKREATPLADRMRPQRVEDFVGQAHLMTPGKPLYEAIKRQDVISMILWGPPGSGKTTLARIMVKSVRADFYPLSAVTSGVAEVRKVIDKGIANRRLGKRTILFIDEIHRFNKAQQDALLHSVEDGTVTLIGATTENPSFEVIAPLLSRCQTYILHPLSEDELAQILDRALQQDDMIKAAKVKLHDQARATLLQLAGGDARAVLSGLELAIKMAKANADGVREVTAELVGEAVQRKPALYDRQGDNHYDAISAFIKSVRGSDPDAALHYLSRMIAAGEDPKFIARRLIILASEDIGNADPQALLIATAAFTAITYIGMPEGALVLAQATTYLASTAKSNASYKALQAAQEDLTNKGLSPIPLHLRNAATPLMKKQGYGVGYQYPHDFPGNFVEQNYLPENLHDALYYLPTESGEEKKLLERLKSLWKKYRER